MTRIERLVIHHSASDRDTTTIEIIREWHKDRGFRDVGYNYVIEADGQLRIGRPLPETGAHARGFNATSIGVCVTGHNLSSGQGWNAEQATTLRRFVSAVLLLWPGLKVCGHRDLASTACPGLDVVDLLNLGG